MARYDHICENKECRKEFFNYKAGTRFCCMTCRSFVLTRIVVCDNCGREKRKPLSDIFEKSKNNFCGMTCKKLFYKGSRSNLYNMGERYLVESTNSVFVWCGNRYRAEHRVLVEQFIGRELIRWGEPILHINGINSDNALENLYVCNSMSEMKSITGSASAPYPYKSNLQQLKENYEQTNTKD